MARFVLALLVLVGQGSSAEVGQAPSYAGDDSMLIQTAGRRAASSQAAVALTQNQARTSAMLGKVEQMAESIILGEEKITNATRFALETIDSEMDSIIANAAQNQMDFQATVDRAKQSVEACGTDTTNSYTREGGINNRSATVNSVRLAHSDCRKQEVTLKEDDTTKCNALDTYVKDLQGQASGLPTSSDISSCMCAQPSKHCVEKMATWSTTASTTWQARETACTDSTVALSTQRSSCDTLQGTFESDFCAYEAALSTVCSTQETCRATQIGLRNKTHASVVISESAFKSEYESAKHVKCILQVLNATEADKRGMLKACRDSTVESSHLGITYLPIPSPTACDLTPVTTVPCDADWEATEYRNKNWHATASAHTCTPCGVQEATSAASVTTHTPTTTQAPATTTAPTTTTTTTTTSTTASQLLKTTGFCKEWITASFQECFDAAKAAGILPPDASDSTTTDKEYTYKGVSIQMDPRAKTYDTYPKGCAIIGWENRESSMVGLRWSPSVSDSSCGGCGCPNHAHGALCICAA